MNRTQTAGLPDGGGTAQARGVGLMTGMAVGFRAFYAVTVDGDGLMGSGWIAALAGMMLAILPVLGLMAIRRARPADAAEAALRWAVGKWGGAAAGLILFSVLTYDAAASMRIMTSTAKYVAMPEGNRSLILIVTALSATMAGMMGAGAAAGGAVMWRRLMAALILMLVIVQAPNFRAAWLMPVLGPGAAALAQGALPAAGIFSLSAAGWLMIPGGEDKSGRTMLASLLKSGLITTALVIAFCMLTPGMPGEPSLRSFRLGRLLANDRAGLSLELPYVTLIFSGMFAMLIFELTAAACSLRLALPGVKYPVCAAAAGLIALILALCGLAERETVQAVSGWYYLPAALPFCAAGVAACVRSRAKGKAGEGRGRIRE